MRRLSIPIGILAVILLGLASVRTMPTGAQNVVPTPKGHLGLPIPGAPDPADQAPSQTPPSVQHPLIGTWIVTDTSAGQPGTLTTVITYAADGTALFAGFGDNPRALQGEWTATGPSDAALTVVGLQAGKDGTIIGTSRIRGVATANATGDTFVGAYTIEVLAPDGEIQFTFQGTLRGTRIGVEPMAPVPSSATATPVTE